MSDEKPDIDLVVSWMERAEKNCRATGKKDSALLWQDGRYAIEYLRGQVSKLESALQSARKTAMEDAISVLEPTFLRLYEYLTNTQYHEIRTLEKAIRAKLEGEGAGK